MHARRCGLESGGSLACVHGCVCAHARALACCIYCVYRRYRVYKWCAGVATMSSVLLHVRPSKRGRGKGHNLASLRQQTKKKKKKQQKGPSCSGKRPWERERERERELRVLCSARQARDTRTDMYTPITVYAYLCVCVLLFVTPHYSSRC